MLCRDAPLGVQCLMVWSAVLCMLLRCSAGRSGDATAIWVLARFSLKPSCASMRCDVSRKVAMVMHASGPVIRPGAAVVQEDACLVLWVEKVCQVWWCSVVCEQCQCLWYAYRVECFAEVLGEEDEVFVVAVEKVMEDSGVYTVGVSFVCHPLLRVFGCVAEKFPGCIGVSVEEVLLVLLLWPGGEEVLVGGRSCVVDGPEGWCWVLSVPIVMGVAAVIVTGFVSAILLQVLHVQRREMVCCLACLWNLGRSKEVMLWPPLWPLMACKAAASLAARMVTLCWVFLALLANSPVRRLPQAVRSVSLCLVFPFLP
eukprot:s1206_g26.t1